MKLIRCDSFRALSVVLLTSMQPRLLPSQSGDRLSEGLSIFARIEHSDESIVWTSDVSQPSDNVNVVDVGSGSASNV